GQIMLGLALGMASGWVGGLAILGFLPIALYVPLKNRITFPRLGYVEFISKPSREALLKIGYPIFFCTCMVIFLLIARVPEGVTPVAEVWTPSEAWPTFRLWLQGKEPFLLGLAMLVVFGVVGLATEIRRMFIYAVLGLIIMLSGQLLNSPIFIPLFVLSGIAFAVGIIMLIRFLRKYPKISDDEILPMGHTNHASR
ncbi:MAG: hypothetical protein JSV37_09635, partial [Anaerolineaceae bacterium]